MRATAEAIAAEMTAIIQEAVMASRAVQGDLKRAIPDVARRYRLTERRVQSYWWSAVKVVPAHERELILRAREKDLMVRASQQELALARTRAALERQRSADADTRSAHAGGHGLWAHLGLQRRKPGRAAAAGDGGGAQIPLNFGCP